jgi:lipopolysaccharide transport system ATP-binding protein
MTLKSALSDFFLKTRKRTNYPPAGGSRLPLAEDETIWALRNVSFEIKPGEAVAILGRNGAGKTTLLRILGRITNPSEGYAEISGRTGSIMEIGAGFHPELTGRENIYLNGVIMGMTRQEIKDKFDSIASFAAIDDFLDTPVKHYSSGMSVRLSFAIAAHLEPEILLIDEVLAVGDFEFQQKCIRKMKNIVQEGRTVLFVSHDLPAIRELCPRGILIERGRLVDIGETSKVITRYLADGG